VENILDANIVTSGGNDNTDSTGIISEVVASADMNAFPQSSMMDTAEVNAHIDSKPASDSITGGNITSTLIPSKVVFSSPIRNSIIASASATADEFIDSLSSDLNSDDVFVSSTAFDSVAGNGDDEMPSFLKSDETTANESIIAVNQPSSNTNYFDENIIGSQGAGEMTKTNVAIEDDDIWAGIDIPSTTQAIGDVALAVGDISSHILEKNPSQPTAESLDADFDEGITKAFSDQPDIPATSLGTPNILEIDNKAGGNEASDVEQFLRTASGFIENENRIETSLSEEIVLESTSLLTLKDVISIKTHIVAETKSFEADLLLAQSSANDMTELNATDPFSAIIDNHTSNCLDTGNQPATVIGDAFVTTSSKPVEGNQSDDVWGGFDSICHETVVPVVVAPINGQPSAAETIMEEVSVVVTAAEDIGHQSDNLQFSLDPLSFEQDPVAFLHESSSHESGEQLNSLPQVNETKPDPFSTLDDKKDDSSASDDEPIAEVGDAYVTASSLPDQVDDTWSGFETVVDAPIDAQPTVTESIMEVSPVVTADEKEIRSENLRISPKPLPFERNPVAQLQERSSFENGEQSNSSSLVNETKNDPFSKLDDSLASDDGLTAEVGDVYVAASSPFDQGNHDEDVWSGFDSISHETAVADPQVDAQPPAESIIVDVSPATAVVEEKEHLDFLGVQATTPALPATTHAVETTITEKSIEDEHWGEFDGIESDMKSQEASSIDMTPRLLETLVPMEVPSNKSAEDDEWGDFDDAAKSTNTSQTQQGEVKVTAEPTAESSSNDSLQQDEDEGDWAEFEGPTTKIETDTDEPKSWPTVSPSIPIMTEVDGTADYAIVVKALETTCSSAVSIMNPKPIPIISTYRYVHVDALRLHQCHESH
jgi:hypothetical protein